MKRGVVRVASSIVKACRPFDCLAHTTQLHTFSSLHTCFPTPLLAKQDRSVVPIDLAICRLSGTGVDSVFLGTVNAAMHDDQGLPLYALPDSGTVLCVDPRFPDHFGHSESDYTGKPLGTFILESEEFQWYAVHRLLLVHDSTTVADSTYCLLLLPRLLHDLHLQLPLKVLRRKP